MNTIYTIFTFHKIYIVNSQFQIIHGRLQKLHCLFQFPIEAFIQSLNEAAGVEGWFKKSKMFFLVRVWC